MPRDHQALHRWLAERSRLPFGGYAEWECCVRFAAGAVEAQTGVDPLPALQGPWETPPDAARALLRVGGLEAGVDQVLAAVPIGLAQRGDVGFVPAPEAAGGGVLVIVEGDHLIGPDTNGVRRMPRAAMTRAWRAA